ncbi:PASTA domain-containing protein [Actinopolymorpha sp. B9G3]|uniref:protein kinase domain-containing protein n=1 Tax=Actinopolymorpha sp. B9G3 TaxID=3158970 RepID=UPI0032D90CBE
MDAVQAASRDDLVVGERYVVRDQLGTGGCAVVHLADDLRLGRRVAVKMLHPHLAADAEIASAFVREAWIAASLNHPGIVAVYDVCDPEIIDQDVPWMALELVNGQTVREILETSGPMTPREALTVTAHVLDALGHSHASGIVHRDVSPGNVMITVSGQVKVTDFGIAAAVSSTTGAGSRADDSQVVLGTPSSISPEQARGAEIDARSDLYSVGCLLFALLTGTSPFTGESAHATVWAHVHQEPPSPSAINPDVPRSLDPPVLRALAKDPADRFPDAAAMRAAIIAAAHDLPVDDHSRPLAADLLPDTQDPPARQPGRLVLAMTGAALVLCLLSGWSLWWSTLDRQAPDGSGELASVVVPDLAGLTVAEAEHRLRARGLRTGEHRVVESDAVRSGRVIRSEPPAGALVARRDTVRLVVSSDAAEVTMPQLAGLSLDQASIALDRAGLRLGATTERDASDRARTVLDTTPVGGATVLAGTKVELTVASGWSSVPDVTGYSVADARRALELAGFRPHLTSEGTSSSSVANQPTVLSTRPQAGTRSRVESAVHMLLAGKEVSPTPRASTNGPKPTPTPSSPPPRPSPQPTPSTRPTTPRPTETPTATPTPTPSPSPSPTPTSEP